MKVRIRGLGLICLVCVLAFRELGAEDWVMKKGEWLFHRKCAYCHEKKGQGGLGPNLTDWYFIYGPETKVMKTVIENGVPAKGMPAWKDFLTEEEINAILLYTCSIRGKKIPGRKEEGVWFDLKKMGLIAKSDESSKKMK